MITGFRGDRSMIRYAEILGVSRTAVHKYEHGVIMPRWAILALIIDDANLSNEARAAFLDLVLLSGENDSRNRPQ